MPRFIFGFRVNSTLNIGTVGARRIPFFTTITGTIEQIVRLKTLCRHPIFIVTPIYTIQFIDQVRKPTLCMASFGPPMIFCHAWRKRSGPGLSTGEMDWPREWVMCIFTFLQTSGRLRKVFITALLGCSIDFEVIRLVQLRFAVARLSVRKPRAVPPWRTTCPRVGMNSLCTWMVTLFVVVQTYSNWAITPARPGIENAPPTISPDILTPLRWICRR